MPARTLRARNWKTLPKLSLLTSDHPEWKKNVHPSFMVIMLVMDIFNYTPRNSSPFYPSNELFTEAILWHKCQQSPDPQPSVCLLTRTHTMCLHMWSMAVTKQSFLKARSSWLDECWDSAMWLHQGHRKQSFLERIRYRSQQSALGLTEHLPVSGKLCKRLNILQATSALLGDLLRSQT